MLVNSTKTGRVYRNFMAKTGKVNAVINKLAERFLKTFTDSRSVRTALNTFSDNSTSRLCISARWEQKTEKISSQDQFGPQSPTLTFFSYRLINMEEEVSVWSQK